MCTFNIAVEENDVGQELRNAHTYEEMKSALRERIDCMESGQATFHSNDEVFLSIRERYGF